VAALQVGDRVEVKRGGRETGTAIELRSGKVLVSFYANGEQVWFDLAEIVKAEISPKNAKSGNSSRR
jgi:hypothetical protein